MSTVIECDGSETVTPSKPVQAYYSNYGGLPECFLEPGDIARVIAKKVPSVRGPRPYFTLVEFEKLGHTWRASLYPGEFKRV
jgi:hypothetical protein